MKIVFLIFLMLFHGFALAESENSIDSIASNFLQSDEYQDVKANKVEVGLGIRLIEVASIAFNPSQNNTYWPLYAYSVDTVFDSRSCDSFDETALDREIAFVSSKGYDDKEDEFTGTRVNSHIKEICDNNVEKWYLNIVENFKNWYQENGDSRKAVVEDFEKWYLENIVENSGEWYLLSKKPIAGVKSDFRTTLDRNNLEN